MKSDRVQRVLRSTWRNDRGGRWTRRVRWYEWSDGKDVSIRLNFAERRSFDIPRNRWVEVNRYYGAIEEAKADMFRFIHGERAATLRNEDD